VRTVAFAQERFDRVADKTSSFAKHLELQLLVSHFFAGSFDWERLRQRAVATPRLGLVALSCAWPDVVDAYARAKGQGPLVRLFNAGALSNAADRVAAFGSLAHDEPAGLIATLARFQAYRNALLVSSWSPEHSVRRLHALELGAVCAGETRWPLLALAVARRAKPLASASVDDANRVLALYERAADAGAGYHARLEAAELLVELGRGSEAAQRFVAAYDEAMSAGELPPFGASLFKALDVKHGDTTEFDVLVERIVRWAEETKNGEALLVLASSLRRADQKPTAERTLRRLAAVVQNDGSRDGLRFLLALLWDSWNEPARAEEGLRELLAKPELERSATLHEQAGRVAEKLGHVAAAIADHERALSLELESMKEDGAVVDLEALRFRASQLVGLYVALAKTTHVPGTVSRELAGRILALGDRLRSVWRDDDSTEIGIARALQACGAEDDAWDVASEAIERHPAEGAGYSAVAAFYASEGKLELAASLYEKAAAVEPTDPTPLVEEAKVLEREGEVARARALYRTVLGKKWHDRFWVVVRQAQEAIGR
jgi:tetratricopeptide (TPR) repeat protein